MAGAKTQVSRSEDLNSQLGSLVGRSNKIVDYQDVLRSLADGYYECDLEGCFSFVNPAFCRLLGRTEEEVVGESFTSMTVPSNVANIRGYFQEIYDQQSTSGKFTWVINRDDQDPAFAEGSISLMRDDDGTVIGYRGMIIDISDRREMELQLEKSHEELQRAKSRAESHAEQLAAQADQLTRARNDALDASRLKSQFVANVSHEIRTPMNGILGMTNLALECTTDETLQDYLKTIMSSANALLTVVNDILDFSKIEAGKLQLEEITFDLRDCIEDSLKPYRIEVEERGIKFSIELESGLSRTLSGDPSRLRQILINLVGNAAKFTEKGEIAVEVKVKSGDERGTTLQFSVRDSGIGIPQALQRQVFAAFAQGDGSATRRHGGTGLGLSISSHLVKLMGGSIWVESEPGHGSTFSFTVRFRPAEPIGLAVDKVRVLERARVLVVDDGSDRHDGLAEALLQAGHIVNRAKTGADIWERLLEAHGKGQPYEVLVLDTSVDATTHKLAEAIGRNKELRTIRVILLALQGQRGDGARCREIGVAGYLTQPIRPVELVETIRLVLSAKDSNAQKMITRHDLRELNNRCDVLVAEDNPINQMVIRKVLKNLGHQVTIVENGRKAVDAALDHDFDIILMDVQMPEMDGVEATRAIREHEEQQGSDKSIPIVAVTAHAMKGDREEFLAAGMNAYVSKPFTPVELETTICSLVDKLSNAEKSSVSGPRVASINRSELRTQVACDIDLLREVAEMFFEDGPQMLVTIDSALKEGRNDLAIREVQKLQSSLVALAAHPAVGLATELERILGTEDEDRVGGVLDDLKHHIGLVEQELRSMVRQGSDCFAQTI